MPTPAAAAGSPRATFAALWDFALGEAAGRDLGSPAALRALARASGLDAFACIIAALGQDRAGLSRNSASLLSGLTLLWAAAGIEPEEIWMELHKRERLGSLLAEMASGEGKPKRGRMRPWRVDSTKLP